MALDTAFKRDGAGPYCLQDPDDDLDYTFVFRDEKKPTLAVGENIVTIIELSLTRLDATPIGTEETHDQNNDNDNVLIWIRKLKIGVNYNVECTIETSNVPVRRYSRSFRILCRER